MQTLHEPVRTHWVHGRFDGRPREPQLLFGRMYEDSLVEAHLFRPRCRVFCVASAGCTALALARRGHRVTAVDINPQQVAYVRRRREGGPALEGRAEKLLDAVRRLLPALGWTRRSLESFARLTVPDRQEQVWLQRLSTRRARVLIACLGRIVPPLYARAFLRWLPDNFFTVLLKRFGRGFARHPNRWNPYAWRLLTGYGPPRARTDEACSAAVRLVCADAVEHLCRCPPGCFDAYSLSNVLDGASRDFGRRLWSAVRRTAAPGAVVVLRSLGEPRRVLDAQWSALDRSMLWGSVSVDTVGRGAQGHPFGAGTGTVPPWSQAP